MIEVKVIQLNVGRKQGAHYSILEQATSLRVDIVALQEPYMPRISSSDSSYWITPSAPSFDPLPPLPNYRLSPNRPRVFTYIRKGAGLEVSPRYDLFNDPDIQAFEVKKGNLESFLVINCYNEKEQGVEASRAQTTLSRALLKIRLPRASPTLLLGDFNLHHPRWNASTIYTSEKANTFISWLDIRRFDPSSK